MKENEILVSICCMAYNQERYIRKCIESLVMQKTDFEYEILIHDDASTDKTAQIIREYEKRYPEIIKPIYQTENQYSKGIAIDFKYQYAKANGKYIALCEGDDFWTDDKKLQTQVDFLEANIDYVLCGHAAYRAYGDDLLANDIFFSYGIGTTRTMTTEEIIEGWAMATNSMVFRKSALNVEGIPYKGNALNGDYALMTYLSLQGKVYFIDKLMSAYRVDSVGSVMDVWRQNLKKRLDAGEKLLALLERLDLYTSKVYTVSVNKKRSIVLYGLLEDCDDLSEFKRLKLKYNDIYKRLKVKLRIELFLSSYFPKVYTLLKLIKSKIKRIIKRKEK